MAKIQGITIELGADASGIEQALKDVDKASSKTTKELGQINKALKFDPDNAVLLQQKMEVLGDAINNTSDRLTALRRAQAELDRQIANGDSVDPRQYRALAREIEQTEGILRSFQRQVDNTEIRLDAQVDTSGIDKMKQALDEVGEKAKEIGTEMSTTISAPLAAFGTGALLSAAQFDNAAGQIQAALGVTSDEAERLEDIATSVWKEGFGESLEEVSDGLVRVQQNMKEIDGSELENVTKNAIALADVFESDVNEVTRGANNLMVNFGVTSEEAFDLMARGAQDGLNFSNELFDNLAEYSGLFANMGYTAEEYFGILERGSDAGVYNLDYLNDVMKEFQIRVKDGSDATATAMGDLSQATQDVWDKFYHGEATVKDVASSVIKDLQSMDDQTYAGMLGVELFGTKWEDLESKAMYAMLGTSDGLDNVKGSMDALVEARENTFGARWETLTRTAAASLEPVGKILLDFAEQWLPKIVELIASLTTWFSNLSPIVQILAVVFGAVIAAIGPLLVIFGSIVSALSTIIPLFASGGAVATAFGTVMAVLTGPIGIAIAAIVGIVAALITAYAKVEWFRDGVNSIFNVIKDYTSQAFGAVKELITSLIGDAVEFGKGLLDEFKVFWDENGKEILAGVKSSFEKIKSNIEMVMGVIKGIFQVAWPIISGVVKVAWELIQLTVGNAIKAVLGVIQTVMKLLQGDWKGAWETIKSTAEGIMKNIIKFFKDINLLQIGKDIIRGLINGIGSMKDAVMQKAGEIANSVKDKIAGALKIKSPSRVMMGFGENIGEGLVIGMDDMIKKVAQSSARLSNAVINVQGSLSNSASKQQTSQVTQQQIINNSSVNLNGLVQAIAELAQRPIQTNVSMDGRVIATAVSGHQYNTATLSALSKGVSL